MYKSVRVAVCDRLEGNDAVLSRVGDLFCYTEPECRS